MFINPSQAMKVMEAYNLKSFDELFLIQCVYTKDTDTLYKFFTKVKNTLFTNDVIHRLAKDGIFQEEPLKYTNGSIEIFDLFLTTDFIQKFFPEVENLGKELWNVYPNTAFINGQDVVLKKGEKIGNVYYDKDKLMSVYCEKIKFNKELHQQIIAKVNKNKDMINFTLRSFILDELWESLPDTTQKQIDNTDFV